MSIETSFAGALLAEAPICPSGLRAWNGSNPEKRFAVYRNNVIVGLVDALADSFPVTQELVGEEFFRAMAREFVRASPPTSPVLAFYGEGFADFIADFPPAAGLSYLSDLARLEYLRMQAWHAADADVLAPQQLAALLADPVDLPESCLVLHPSLQLLVSNHAVVSLWAAHQVEATGDALAAVDPARAEAALLCRQGLEVETYLIDTGAADFVALMQQGSPVGVAALHAGAAHSCFDLPATLALLLRCGAITGITIPRRIQT